MKYILIALSFFAFNAAAFDWSKGVTHGTTSSVTSGTVKITGHSESYEEFELEEFRIDLDLDVGSHDDVYAVVEFEKTVETEGDINIKQTLNGGSNGVFITQTASLGGVDFTESASSGNSYMTVDTRDRSTLDIYTDIEIDGNVYEQHRDHSHEIGDYDFDSHEHLTVKNNIYTNTYIESEYTAVGGSIE